MRYRRPKVSGALYSQRRQTGATVSSGEMLPPLPQTLWPSDFCREGAAAREAEL